jgi:hypothetical protein
MLPVLLSRQKDMLWTTKTLPVVTVYSVAVVTVPPLLIVMVVRLSLATAA